MWFSRMCCHPSPHVDKSRGSSFKCAFTRERVAIVLPHYDVTRGNVMVTCTEIAHGRQCSWVYSHPSSTCDGTGMCGDMATRIWCMPVLGVATASKQYVGPPLSKHDYGSWCSAEALVATTRITRYRWFAPCSHLWRQPIIRPRTSASSSAPWDRT